MTLTYTRPACLQLLDTLRSLKRSSAKRINVLQEQEAGVQNDLIAARQTDSFLDIFTETVYDRIRELDERDADDSSKQT